MNEINSKYFDPNWFNKTVIQDQESTFLDFKQGVFKVQDEKYEFQQIVRHLIAFANTSRRTGLPCWILFGVDDRTRQLYDVRDQFILKSQPPDWQNPTTNIHKKQVDGVKEPLCKIIKKWIEPIINFSLEYGEVNGTFVSYIEIEPQFPLDPYKLKRGFKEIQPGTTYIRYGSSSRQVRPQDSQLLLSKCEAEYIKYEEWQNLINYYLSGEFEKAFKIPPYYNHKTYNDNKDNLDALDSVKNALENKAKCILITADAGVGKTVFLHRLAYILCNKYNNIQLSKNKYFGEMQKSKEFKKNDEKTEITKEEICDLEVTTIYPIPIFMSLRTTFNSPNELNQLLLNNLKESLSNDKSDSIERFYKIPNSNWIILLDGVDEIRNKEINGAILSEWIHLLPNNVQVVITSRPFCVNNDIADVHLQLALLKEDEIYRIIKWKINQSNPEQGQIIFNEINKITCSYPDLLIMLKRFRAIEGLLKYLVNDYEFFHPQIDQQQTKVTRIINNNSSTEIQMPSTIQIPKPISIDELGVENNLDADIDYATSPSDYSDDEGDEKLVITLTSILRSIINFMKIEEIKRQNEFGIDAEKLSNESLYELSRIAWELNWTELKFNSKTYEEKRLLNNHSLQWNEFVGFIIRKKYPIFEFWCRLFKLFLCAEYATINSLQEEILSRINNQGGMTNPINKILKDLINDLLLENGQIEINPQEVSK